MSSVTGSFQISDSSSSSHHSRRHKHHHSLAELSSTELAATSHRNPIPEARDSRLRSILGRMSPEEQLDKYLKSVQHVQARSEKSPISAS